MIDRERNRQLNLFSWMITAKFYRSMFDR
jgi:hypothetical protein